MEREPDNFYARGKEWPASQERSSETLPSPAEQAPRSKKNKSPKNPESIGALGREALEALEHELSFERDPRLRHLTSEQVKAILAAQERAERAAHLGSSSIQSAASQPKGSTKQASQRRSGPTGLGTVVFGRRAADYVMAAIILFLLLVVFLLLIF